MPQKPRLIQLPLAGKIFLVALAGVYIVYLVTFGKTLFPSVFTSRASISEHDVQASPNVVLQHWTAENMRNAIDADQLVDNSVDLAQANADTTTQGQAAQQEGQPPENGKATDPLSVVGKLFFSNASGQNMVCSGTAVTSDNQSTVDTAGHCLYWNSAWVRNVIFCPLYNNGNTPYGCWAARDLLVPSEWIDASPNDLHRDFGMAIVAPNDQGKLTDIVGGAGWAYNLSVTQNFSAYGYPAAHPFNGQTRQSCENRSSRSWQHAGGLVVSIPCNMTGGSSGGPWFVQINGKLYLNGHNDFTSSIQPGHMFSPYYDGTWYALYDKAQHT
jgi:V8-like Glu-specific endopeptidase